MLLIHRYVLRVKKFKTHLEWERIFLLRYQVSCAGGREPVERQVTSVFLPADTYGALEIISTLSGLTGEEKRREKDKHTLIVTKKRERKKNAGNNTSGAHLCSRHNVLQTFYSSAHTHTHTLDHLAVEIKM